MEDERNTIERAQAISRNYSGEEISQDGILQEFQLYGLAKRAATLEQLDVEVNAADTSDLRKYHELTSFRRQMQAVHHTLRKVNR